jgi:hypothetical protein
VPPAAAAAGAPAAAATTAVPAAGLGGATSRLRARLGRRRARLLVPLLLALLLLGALIGALPVPGAGTRTAPATSAPPKVVAPAPAAGAARPPAATAATAAPPAPPAASVPTPAPPVLTPANRPPAPAPQKAPASTGSGAAAPVAASPATAATTPVAPSPAPTPSAAPPTPAPTSAPPSTAAPPATATAEPPRPTATATPQVFLLQLASAGYRQDGQVVGFGLAVENPNPDVAVEGVEYQINAVGAGQTVLGGMTGRVPVIPPSQRLGVAGRFEVAPGASASSIAVHLSPGRPAASVSRVALVTERVFWRDDGGRPRVVGVVVNPSAQASGRVAVTALAFDAGKKIVGSGSATADPVPAQGRASVEVPVVSSPAVSEVELYATSE